jgi:Uma2 family endonuclease
LDLSRISASEYFRLAEEGTITPADRVELIDGVVVAMSPQNPPHAAATSRAARVLSRLLGERAAIRVQMPLVLGQYFVPEPDLVVAPGSESAYDLVHPTSALLVIEVADTSLAQDRLSKIPLYAAAAVPEVWLIDLRNDCVQVFREPQPRARRYRSVRKISRSGRIAPVMLGVGSLRVDELLPAASARTGRRPS